MTKIDPNIDRRSAIAAFRRIARAQDYVIIQDALEDIGERRDAWDEIEDGRYPLADLHALIDLLRERGSPPSSLRHSWLQHVPDAVSA